jgi:hypothetical protein
VLEFKLKPEGKEGDTLYEVIGEPPTPGEIDVIGVSFTKFNELTP